MDLSKYTRVIDPKKPKSLSRVPKVIHCYWFRCGRLISRNKPFISKAKNSNPYGGRGLDNISYYHLECGKSLCII